MSHVRPPLSKPDKKPEGHLKKGGTDSKEKDISASLEKFMHIQPQPFNTVSAPYVFEGVDYDLLKNLSEKTYADYYDCSYWWTRCIRDTFVLPLYFLFKPINLINKF